MSSWAAPGVKCVCVDASWPDGTWHGDEALPEAGRLYTIRGVQQHVSGEWGILLEEVVNPPMDYADGVREAFWALRRFQPIVTRTQQQDVALFRSLVADLPVEADA